MENRKGNVERILCHRYSSIKFALIDERQLTIERIMKDFKLNRTIDTKFILFFFFFFLHRRKSNAT